MILIPSPGLFVEWRNGGESVAGGTDVVGASWYLVIIPITDQSAETIARLFIFHWVLKFGTPLFLISDQVTLRCGREVVQENRHWFPRMPVGHVVALADVRDSMPADPNQSRWKASLPAERRTPTPTPPPPQRHRSTLPIFITSEGAMDSFFPPSFRCLAIEKDWKSLRSRWYGVGQSVKYLYHLTDGDQWRLSLLGTEDLYRGYKHVPHITSATYKSAVTPFNRETSATNVSSEYIINPLTLTRKQDCFLGMLRSWADFPRVVDAAQALKLRERSALGDHVMFPSPRIISLLALCAGVNEDISP
uniref:Uncharacterized protein n=1 Tax=Timema cristinae TaxID=61476 RepID=A0A7R9CYU4_TIMCR|nr:unnamed protein product [Timema cristinae]